MTDKLEALSQPVRIYHDWNSATTAHCGKCDQWEMTIADAEGVQTCASCYDAEWLSEWQGYAEALEQRVVSLQAALEEKGQEVNQLKSDYQKLAQEHRFLANESARKGVRNAELEQRLQQPIKLPVDFDWSGDGDYVMTANEVRDAIKDAGYQVEGE